MSKSSCTTLINTGSFAETGESADYSPQNMYAASKYCFQNILEYYVQINKISAITLRLMDVYGPNDPRNKIWPQLIDCIKNPKNLAMTLGEQIVNTVHVADVCSAFIGAWELIQTQTKYQHKIYYVAATKAQSLRNTVAVLERVSGTKLPIVWGGKPYREREIMRPYVGEVLPNWQPKIDLETGFLSMVQTENTALC
jgi:nucleoside-diphosphate-sugar epimerase